MIKKSWKLVQEHSLAKAYKITGTNGEIGILAENPFIKKFRSPDYNYNFDKTTGFFVRWGKTPEDDPVYSPFGPEILDIEISTICHQNCSQCYKSNTSVGTNMTLNEFRELMEVVYSPFLTQIAFGVGSLDSSEYIFPIMEYTRSLGVIPNITINGSRMTDELFEKLAMVCGAVSISNYSKDLCYNTVQRLNQEKKNSGATLKQCNIHQLLALDSLPSCWEVLHDMQTDPRLSELGSVVLLTLKPKGKRNNLTQLNDFDEYKKLITYALDNKLKIGFDSCGCASFEKAIVGRDEESELRQVSEKCESSCFSLYVDVRGSIYPCSFAEGTTGWEEGIPAAEHDSINDIWNHERLKMFRETLLSNCRNCPLYDLEIRCSK